MTTEYSRYRRNDYTLLRTWGGL